MNGDRLIFRLQQDDGLSWFQQIAVGDIGDAGGERAIADELRHYLQLAERIGDDASLPADGDHRATYDLLLDLAALAPAPWGEQLARAALQIQPQHTAASREDRIGDYRLLEPIGRGGMGVVWRALQLSTQRSVAVKLVRSDLLTPEAVKRFVTEGKLLAQLNHPGIPHVLQMGVDEAVGGALPFLAMELVEGQPLADYVRNRDLSITARLRVLVAIAEAVAHAHAHGIVHRDLKPANVVVDNQGHPKLLDFGVARRLDPDVALALCESVEFGPVGPDSTDVQASSRKSPEVRFGRWQPIGLARAKRASGGFWGPPDGQGYCNIRVDQPPEDGLPQTRSGQLLGTVAYMSPEQARGHHDTVDRRSDVYSLGVIAYELLSGELPHNVTDLPLHQAIAQIVERPPPRLDARLPAVPRDLAIIIDKCLAVEPDQRYADAGEFVDDLRRLVENQPIVARPKSLRYLLRKFLGRHRMAAVAAAFVVLSIAVGLGFATHGWSRASKAEGAMAELLRGNLIGARRLVESTQPTEQVQRSLAHLTQSLATPGWAEVRHPGVRAELAQLHDLLGDLRLRVGQRTESAWHRRFALKLTEQLATEHVEDAVAQARYSIALVKIGDLAKDRRDLDEARRLYQQALQIDQQLVATAPTVLGYLDNLTWSYLRLAEQDVEAADMIASLRRSHAAVQSAKQLVALDAERTGSYYALFASLANLDAQLTLDAQFTSLRRACAEDALAATAALVAREPGRTTYQMAWVNAHVMMVRTEVLAGDYDAAREHVELALTEARRLCAADSSRVDLQTSLALVLRFAANVECSSSNSQRALALVQEMVALASVTAQAAPDSGYRQHRLAEVLGHAADLSSRAGDAQVAGAYAEKSIATYEQLALSGRSRAKDHTALATLLLRFGDYPEAAERALAVIERDIHILNGNNPSGLHIYERVLRALGRESQANQVAVRLAGVRAEWRATLARSASGSGETTPRD